MNWRGSSEGCYALPELLSGIAAPPPPLFGGLLLENSLTVVSGTTHVGKSLLLAHMALCLDLGLPLFGKFPPREPKRVLALLQDSPTWDYAEQLRKIARGFNMTSGLSEMTNAAFIFNRQIDVSEAEFKLELERLAGEEPFDVLMLDALWTFHCFDERDQGQMGLVAKRLKWARDHLGVSVIFTHHTRKMNAADSAVMGANERTRGSRVIVDAADFHMHLTRKGTRVRVELPKARGENESLTYFDINEVDHPDGTALRLEAPDENASRTGQILSFLRETRKRAEIEAFLRTQEPALTAGQARKAVDNTLRLLQSLNKVERIGYGNWCVRRIHGV